MRPLKLELEGFGSYRKRQEIPLDDVDLFVITGPTGSGKSTLLEAMTFALFGAVPRLGKRDLGQMLHPGALRAWVALTFGVGGRVYRVERELGKKAEASLLEFRDGKLHPLVDRGTKGVTEGVERILGLDYDTFVRSVFLPQGEFDQFLRKAQGRERREILDRLFGLEELKEMRERLKERLKELRAKKVGLEEELERLEAEGIRQDRLRELEEELKKAKEERHSLAKRLADLEATRERLERILERVEALGRAQDELDALEGKRGEWEREREKALASQQARSALELWQDLEAKERELREAEEEAEGP